MNNIKSFSFYRNYYELIKYLSNEDRLKLYDGIIEYVFEDKEPQLENLLMGIWVNLKMPLDTSKNNAGRGGKSKAKKTDLKPITNRLKTEKKTNNISTFLFLISNNKYKYINTDTSIYKKIYEWLEYKQERKEKYTETGLKSLLTQIEKKIDIYGENAICNLIDECMSSNYKGIIFEKLEKNHTKKENLPDWFNKEQEASVTDTTQKEMENILKEMEE